MNCILLSSFDKLNYYCVLYGQTASRALFCIHDKKCRGARSSYVRNSVTAFDAVDARSSIPQNGNGLNVSSKYFIAQCIRRYTGLNSTAQSPVYFLWFVYRRRTDVGQYTYTRVFTRLVYIHIHMYKRRLSWQLRLRRMWNNATGSGSGKGHDRLYPEPI